MGKNRFSYATSLGPVTIADDGSGNITHLHLAGKELNIGADVRETDVIRKAGAQVLEYLNGSRKVFDVPLRPEGTEFQLRVWKELRRVPYGTTVTYKDLAVGIGKPSAARAVGMAMNRNPIAIIMPCHRVIGSDGSMTGFANGIDMKVALLKLEGALE